MNSPFATCPPAVPEAIAHADSGQFIGLARLARMAFSGQDLAPIRTRLFERLASNDHDANALMDLSTVLQLMGQHDLGLSMQALALGIQQVYRLENSTGTPGIHLLAFLGPGDLAENNALEFLTEGSDITLDLLYVSPGIPFPSTLPEHDLAMVAICESDSTRPLLANLVPLVKAWPQRVLCAPDRIARLSRDGACGLLHTQPGMVVPVTSRIDRNTLGAVGRCEIPVTPYVPDGGFPVILRPVDSQKGHGLAKVDTPEAIAGYLETRPEEAFYIARYVEYRGADGQFRKYRILLIDGRPYVCHMAISERWVVHYMNAGMVENAAKRAEEAQFFAGFDQSFAHRHQDALRSIAQCTGLEYVGIDCGETPDGDLLIFEVDSGMTVHAMDPVDLFPYKEPQMRKVFHAFRQMLIDTAHPGTAPAKPLAG
jgi:hypothetical protein